MTANFLKRLTIIIGLVLLFNFHTKADVIDEPPQTITETLFFLLSIAVLILVFLLWILKRKKIKKNNDKL